VLGANVYFNSGANLIQWSSGPATLGAVVAFVWMRWNDRCRATRLCVRRGEHPVKGTKVRVCSRHHTLRHHELVYGLHHVEGELGWGDSHTRA
jgi:hypothetical protein